MRFETEQEAADHFQDVDLERYLEEKDEDKTTATCLGTKFKKWHYYEEVDNGDGASGEIEEYCEAPSKYAAYKIFNEIIAKRCARMGEDCSMSYEELENKIEEIR